MRLYRPLLVASIAAVVCSTREGVGQTHGFVADANVGYHRFGELGNGPGIDGGLMYAWVSGLQLGARCEYFFPNTEERFGTDRSEIGVFAEVRYRFSASQPSGPFVAGLVGGQWFKLKFEDGHEQTESDLSSGVAGGYDFGLSDRLWVSASVLASLGDAPQLDKNRIAFRVGVRYALTGG